MDIYRLMVWAHLFFSVVLTGLALFWFVMDVSLRRRFSAQETEGWLKIVKGARWPHVGVPYALRLPLPWLTWVIIGLAAASGAASAYLIERVTTGPLWWAKFALFAAMLVTQGFLAWRPSRVMVRANFAVVLAVVVVSVLAMR